jgi:hypothetical protein
MGRGRAVPPAPSSYSDQSCYSEGFEMLNNSYSSNNSSDVTISPDIWSSDALNGIRKTKLSSAN